MTCSAARSRSRSSFALWAAASVDHKVPAAPATIAAVKPPVAVSLRKFRRVADASSLRSVVIGFPPRKSLAAVFVFTVSFFLQNGHDEQDRRGEQNQHFAHITKNGISCEGPQRDICKVNDKDNRRGGKKHEVAPEWLVPHLL
mmetsp:Transcript_29625/g.58569  ORF Transcript_29625/g.58569 Transcript_29625/m.58569 type:complete len:143 (-) Transcript_29625:44-472(-)